jgi:hypothetical protein
LAQHNQTWHARLHAQAYSDFGAPEPSPDALGYWAAVTGQIAYRSCLSVFWLILNCGTIFLGVFVEPLWRPGSRFRFLRFPGGISVISVALPVLFAFCAYQTFLRYGAWHVFLPFIAIAAGGAMCLGVFAGINALRKRPSWPEPVIARPAQTPPTHRDDRR